MILLIGDDGKRALLEAAARDDDNLPVARLLAVAAVTVFWSEA